MRIGWLIGQNSTYDVASIRYRVAYPVFALTQRGHRCYIFTDPAIATTYISRMDAFVIVKRFDMATLELAAQADDRGIPLVFDLCDDVLMDGYRARRLGENRAVFAGLCELADLLATTTPALAERLLAYSRKPIPTAIIPDVIETPELLKAAKSVFAARLVVEPFAKIAGGAPPRAAPSKREAAPLAAVWDLSRSVSSRLRADLARLRGKSAADIMRYARGRAGVLLRRGEDRKVLALAASRRPPAPPRHAEAGSSVARQSSPPQKTVIWFGNHGAPYSDFGVMTLMRAAPALAAVAKDIPFRLQVITNSLAKVSVLARHLPVPTEFVEWSPDRLEKGLAKASVFLMTRGNDDFASFKSSNRAIKALWAGIPVVAEPMPGLEGLEDVIFTGDLEEGLRRSLSGKYAAPEREALLATPAIARSTVDAVAKAWEAALRQTKQRRDAGLVGRALPNRKVALLVDLLQDVDLALPLIDELSTQGLEPAVIASIRAMRDSRRLFDELARRGVVPAVLDESASSAPDRRWLRGSKVLITMAETTAGPHRIAHRLVKTAKAAGAMTMTLQHGLENIGLTHRDGRYTEAVSILSDRIYIWGRPEALPEWVSDSTRSRAVGVGRVSPVLSSAAVRRPRGKRIIAVFENLHWDRYNVDYRGAFLRDLGEAAAARPDLLFLVKPHPAGRWAAAETRAAEIGSLAGNIVVAHPDDPEWGRYSGPDIVRAAKLVVTTPSTVALDAALANKPVAVAGYGLPDLGIYEPLPLLASAQDWLAAIDEALQTPAALARERARDFRKRVCLGVGAEKRIVADAAAHIASISWRYPPTS